MKLTYIVNARIPTEKAHGVQIMKMCEAFAAGGLEVELVVPRRGDGAADPFEAYGIEKRFSIRRLPVINFFGYERFGFTISSLSFMISVLWYLMGDRTTDVYYSRFQDHFSFVSLFFARRPYFFEVHGPTEKSLAYSFLLSRISGVIATNSFIKDKIVGHYPRLADRIIVRPNGVDIAKYDEIRDAGARLRTELSLPEAKLLVGYVGKLETMGVSKGVDDLLYAFADVVRAGVTNVAVCLVGGPAERIAEYGELARRLGIREYVTFVDHVKPDTVARYLIACDVLAMPFPEKAHYAYFMSPLKTFEYMAAGKIILTSDLPAIKEILDEKSAVFVAPGDRPAIAAALLDIARNPAAYASRATFAYEKAQAYAWKKRAEIISAFMKRAAALG